ncbi:MAG: GntR family transcriptional regulator [Peptoniphilaceae bacterium]|nr:GntR family transcriptional regulator [Peptoniphilaceae bacterium]MDY6018821.1 GntR family transcriptional regulator [Anaerococcus sp.]
MLIEIDLNAKTPIYRQIADKIIAMIGNGDLKEGDKLPSVRNLADVCGINPMTANKSYKILEEEGFVDIQKRSGVRVKANSQVKDEDLVDLRQILLKLFASGMNGDQIQELVGKYLEEICYTD